MSALLTNICAASTSKLYAGREPMVKPENIKTINLEEVSWHDTVKDCWIVLYDRVYDVTDFLDEHPGGDEILLDYAGRDATVAFRGTGHSSLAVKLLDKYFIGELPVHERLFRKVGGIKLSDIPQ